MGLQEQLDQQKRSTINKASPEILQIMAQATTDLKTSGIENQALKAGDNAPDFTLPNAKEEPVTMKSLLRDGPLVINFYRGGWCPYCNLELRALAQIYPQIEALGAKLIGIAPELPDKVAETNLRHSPPFEILSDVGNRLSRQFGLVFTLPESLREIYAGFGIDLPAYNGDRLFELPLPATYVVQSDGRVAFSFVDADYTRRMEPEAILNALRELT